jgi:hypothetical protein
MADEHRSHTKILAVPARTRDRRGAGHCRRAWASHHGDQSFFGGTTEIQKEIIGRGLGLLA